MVDGDAVELVQIPVGGSPTLMRFIHEVKRNIDIMFAAIPRMFFFSDSHQLGLGASLFNAAHFFVLDALRLKIVFDTLASGSRFKGVGVGLERHLIVSLTLLLGALSPRSKASGQH